MIMKMPCEWLSRLDGILNTVTFSYQPILIFYV